MKNFLFLMFCVVVISVIANGCGDAGRSSSSVRSTSTGSYTPPPVNNYQDMRNRGHSEEDAIIFDILKQQGYSDYEAINAVNSSK
jgi:hypothetical protein